MSLLVCNDVDQSPTPTDTQLLRDSLTSATAFDEVYRRHAVDLHRWVLGETRDRSVAVDITAEAFARAWTQRRRFRPPPGGSAAPWLFGIARNLIRTWHHKNRVETNARRRIGMSLVPDIDDDPRLPADETPALANLAELPDDQRAAVTLRVIGEQSYEEIAETVGCSPATARMRVHRGLRTLGTKLEGQRE